MQIDFQVGSDSFSLDEFSWVCAHLADTLVAGVHVDTAIQTALAARAQGEVPVAESTAVAALARKALLTQTLAWVQTCHRVIVTAETSFIIFHFRLCFIR